MRLGEYLPLLAHDAAFWLVGVHDPDYPLAQLGDLSLEVSRKLRAAAVMVLLVKVDTDAFLHNLIRSGTARERYLQRLKDAGTDVDHHRATGRYEPIVDAIAAGDLALARRIAALSPTEWRQGHEYEDDFCWGLILHHLIRDPVSSPAVAAACDRLERTLDGAPSVRLSLARALLDRDQTTFEGAFEALLVEHERRIEVDKERGQLEEPEVVALRQVSIEGLAVLRLAALRGIATRADYRLCPSVARLPMTKPFPGE